MPDTEALSMVDAVAKIGPALSATSDMPKMVSGVGDPTPETVPEKPEPAPPKEDKPEDGKTPETPEPQETPAPEPGAEQPPAAKQSKGVQKRLDELTANWRQEQRRADELQRMLNDALKPKPEPSKSDDPRPKRETFDNPDAYETALIEWSAKQATKTAEQTVKQRVEEEARTKQFNETRQKWADRVDQFSESHEDFKEVAYADTPLFTETPFGYTMTSVVMQLENGPEVVYHLGKHPEIADKIAKFPAALAVFELGKVAASLAAPKPEVSKAPPPIKPVGSRANASRKGPDEMSMEEYASMRQNQRRQEWRERHGMVNGQTS